METASAVAHNRGAPADVEPAAPDAARATVGRTYPYFGVPDAIGTMGGQGVRRFEEYSGKVICLLFWCCRVETRTISVRLIIFQHQRSRRRRAAPCIATHSCASFCRSPFYVYRLSLAKTHVCGFDVAVQAFISPVCDEIRDANRARPTLLAP